MVCFEPRSALMSLSATRRLTGAPCWAIHTVPMPPSPICSKSLYWPITVPGRSVGGCSSTVRPPLPPALPSPTREGKSVEGPCKKLPASRWACNRSSSWARNSASPWQAWSRNAVCSSAAWHSRALLNSSRSFGLRPAINASLGTTVYPSMPRLALACDRRAQVYLESGVRRFLPLAQRGIEPGSGKRPVAIGGPADDAQGLGRLVEREPREETELDQFGAG